MAEIRTKSEEREYLSRLIADWNASRLDIFAIGEPTEDLEYRGVMRFYFQDSGSKIATKCVRFTSRDNTEEVTKVLVEKFHPDMKMLSNPTYSLYEVHPNGDARKLRMDEHPLTIQLEWQLDDREGRFLLKSDSDKLVHSNLFDVKSSDKTVPQATVGQNLKRRLSKREKKQLKKQREEAKKAAEKAGKDDTQIAQHLYDELPETSFTRSISNPEAVMRRRRQQKLEKRLKEFQNKDSPAGGTLKIFATTLKPEIPYKTLLVSVDDPTTHVIKEALIKYQMEKEDPEEYCLVMVNIPAEGTNTSATLGKERVVHDDDCPLKIAVTWPSNRGTVVFHLRRRANLPQHRRDKRRSKSPVRKPIELTPDKTVAERLAKPAYPDHLLPYLLELSSDGNDLDYKARMHRLQMNATEVGSEKTFASGGNYLHLHAPHILPRHCVITNMDGRVSVTPSSGDAEVLVNGKRIYETTQLQHGDVMKIGRLHTFRFCDPAYEKPQRYSAPASGETGSISSNSDIDVQRKQRPQSLWSALPSHHSNSYPSNHIDDHVDIDTNEHPEGMFETTFDVSGEVLTYTGGHRETEPYTYSRPPESPTKTSFSNEYDDKLPATLEFRENGEDAFFAAVISEVNGLAVHFKLAPTYTLYMCSRYRLSPHYRSDLMEHQRGERLGVTILKIANMARSTIRENAEMPGSLAFWMANCSEFLHFIKHDMDISPYTKDGQQVLAQSVQLAFRHLVLCVQHELRTSMSAFLDPTDEADMEESDLDSMNDSDNDHMGMPSDGRSFRVQNKYGQDGRPLSGADSWFGGRRVHGRATVSEVIYNLTSTMSLLRRCRVNAALTIQVFSQLFHFINMWLFNKLVLEPKLDLCTREWGRRISKRLARVEKWAEKQGLELAADCHLCRIAQAAHLLQAPKNSPADINAISSSCFKLNSLQMRTLLENYRPAPDEYLSQEHIERLVATAEEKADEVARSNGQEIQREEETELQLPFLLPEDGYSCEVIRGVPPGLQGFLEPLANTGLCRLTIQPETSGLWTVYQRKHMESSVDVPATITPDVQEVSFNKGRGGMGLSIVAAKGIRQDKLGIYIKQVVKDGPASKDGRLQAGDQILSVNGESLVGVTQEKAAEIMVRSGSIVTLKIVKQGAIYHGLATMLIQQSPNRETAPVPKKLTPVEPEPEPMQLSPTLPENDVRSPGRWLPDSYANESSRQREDEESMREESWRQKEEEGRRAKEEQQRMFEGRMRREDEERMRREDEDRRRREDEDRRRRDEEDRIRQEEEDRIRKEEEERVRLEEEERIRREEEDRLYEERLRREEEEKRLYEERRRQEEEDKRALRIQQEKQEEERRRREAEEDEKFRIQEERIRKRMEEERRIIEEERRKLAEERRLLEEERKKEAERKRTEEQRIIEEERRLAEQKLMIEEERRRVLNQKNAEDETRRLEEEQIALMAQRRRVEEEREIAEQRRREEMEEERRQEEMEEMRRREEIRKREEYRRMEDQRRLAEERRRSEEEERLRPVETKQRTRRIRFEDEVMAAENAPKVETAQQMRSSPQTIETKPEKEIIKPTLKASVEAEKPEITPINKKSNDEYYEEPVVVRGKLKEEEMSSMEALFERFDEENQHVRPNSLNIINKQPIADEPPTSPIRVDSRNTRYGRAIVIKQGMLPSARSPSSQNKTNFDYESVAQNLKAIDQNRRQKEDVNEEDEFERWQRRQREIAEQREREAEERSRIGREQEEMRLREQREREQREREQREREQREREQREREQREREQREREQREREQREREQREREQRERDRQEQEQREELERQRLERERLERERKEYLEQQRKEQEEREKAEEKQRSVEEKKKQEEAEEKRRFIERERKMLSSTSKGSKETLDYIEAMNEEEVEREFRRRLEAENKRRSLDRSYEDRRASGLVSVTRVTYHPECDDQSERDRKLQMIIQERKELERERKESERRVVFQGEREKQKEMQKRQQEDNERQQEDWLRQQREKHEQARREQGRLRMDKKYQEDEDIMKKRSELQQRREQEDVVRMNLQRVREEAERKLNEEHEQQRLEQEQELQRKLEEQKILMEKEGEARRQLQEEQRMRSARGSIGEPDHVVELKERALKDYERRRMLIDQEINRQRADGRIQEQLRQTAMEDVKSKFDQQQQQQPKPVSVLKTSNGTKPKKQVSFSNMSTEFHEPSSPTYVVESSSGYTAKITPAASVRLVQTRPPADLDSPPIPRPPPPDDDDYDDDDDPPPLPPPPPPEELLDDDQFPPPPRTLFNERLSSSSSMSSTDPRSPMDHNSRDYSDVFPSDYPYPPNSHQFKNTVSSYGTYPRTVRPVSYPTPADLDNLQFNDSVRYGGSNNNISGFNSSSGIRQTQSLGRITNTDAVEANRVRMGQISLTDDTRKVPPPVAKKPENLGFKDKMKMFNQDGTPKSRVTISRWEREQMDVNGDVSYT